MVLLTWRRPHGVQVYDCLEDLPSNYGLPFLGGHRTGMATPSDKVGRKLPYNFTFATY